MPKSLTIDCSIAALPSVAAMNGAVCAAAAHIGTNSLGGPGSTTTVGPSSPSGGTTSPGAVPTGSRIVAPSGIVACFKLPAAIET